MKHIYITSILLLSCIFSQANSPSKADRLFDKNDFFRASELYKKAAARHPSQELNFKLGLCYQKMNRYKEAEMSYNKVAAAGFYSNPVFYLDYGLVLKNNSKCEEAKAAFRKYDSLVPDDKRGRLNMNSCSLLDEDHKYDLPVTIANLKALNTPYSDFGAVRYKDGVVFTSSRRSPTLLDRQIDGWTGGFFTDIYYAKKGRKTTDFGKASRLEENMIDLPFHDGSASFSLNFDTIYISRVLYDLPKNQRKNPGVDRIKIYSAKMGEYKWNGMTASALNSNLYSVADPSISPDGKRLYFASDMPGGFGGSDIYYCNREGSGWGKPVNLGAGINTSGRDVFPTADSLGNLYFATDGFGGFGGLDICVALRKDAGFEEAKLMKAPFNSSSDDFAITFIKTGKAGYLSSNRTGGTGDDDIYYFDLGKDSLDKNIVTGIYTVGYRPNQAIARIHVSLIDANTKKAIDDGELSYRNPINLQVEKINFRNGVLEFKVPVKTNLVMEIAPRGFKMISDSVKIPFVKQDTAINLVYNFGNAVSAGSTEPSTVINSKESSVTMTFSTNILFDFDKYSIRSNAIPALDSVVRYMKKNPGLTLLVAAHTDSKGTAEYNNRLSNQRAASTVNYLRSKGIDIRRMKPVGYGFSRPVNKCAPGVECSPEQDQENRRVVFTFSQK